MKAITLSKLQKAARDGQCRLIYFDEAGFSASPSVQRGWSPRGKPHCVTPNPHCRRSVMGALDFGANTLIHEATKQSVKRPAVVQFLDRVAQQADQRPTVVVRSFPFTVTLASDVPAPTEARWLSLISRAKSSRSSALATVFGRIAPCSGQRTGCSTSPQSWTKA